jgi:predicted RNase H-like HicB family nuclease
MLTDYLRAALAHPKIEKLETGGFFLSLAAFPGVWADGETIEEAQGELEDVLEEWIILSLRRGDALPVVGSYDLNAIGALK